jgi:hypothetical protein
MSDEGCPGPGKCHGPLKWCSIHGDVKHVCDMRLRGKRCDEHPVPPERAELKRSRAEAEAKIREGNRLLREGGAAMSEVQDLERARCAYDHQLAEKDHRVFWGSYAGGRPDDDPAWRQE